jgi:hypothetical protein
MQRPDISEMTYQEMVDLRGALNERMKEMRETGITQLRATIAEQAQLLGIEFKDLVPRKPRKKRRRADEDEKAQF